MYQVSPTRLITNKSVVLFYSRFYKTLNKKKHSKGGNEVLLKIVLTKEISRLDMRLSAVVSKKYKIYTHKQKKTKQNRKGVVLSAFYVCKLKLSELILPRYQIVSIIDIY